MQTTGLSLMPVGLEAVISKEEMADSDRLPEGAIA